MQYKRWLSKINLFILAATLTLIWQLILIPVFPKADAQDIYHLGYRVKISRNNHYPVNPDRLLEKGKRLYEQQRFSEAISVLEQAAHIFQNQNNSIKQAIALSNISNSYKQIGEYQQALSYIVQSRQLLEKQSNIDDDKEILKVFAQVLDIQANLQLTLGKPAWALENWKKATAIYKQANLDHLKNRSLINQSLALQALGRYQLAFKILEQVVPELNKQPASILKVTALRNYGDVQLYLGEIDASLKTLQQSYEIAQQIKSNSQIAQTLLSLGNAQRGKGNKNLGLSALQNATIFDKTAPLVYVGKPISQEARKLYRQAVQTYEKTVFLSTSPAIKVKAQLNKFSLLIELEEFSKADELFSQLQSAINKLPVSSTSVKARINLAQNLLLLKQVSSSNAPEWENIAQTLAFSIKQAEILEDTRLQSYATGILGSVYLQTQNLHDAEKLTKKAVDLALRIEAKDIAYLWQWQLGYIFKLEENNEQAIGYYSQAVDNLNDLRGDLLVLNSDIQYSFRDKVEPVYRQLVDLLLQSTLYQNVSQKTLSQKNLNQNKLKKARDVIEALQLREIENYFQEVCLQAKPEIIDTVVDKTDTTAAVIYPIILQNRLEIILKLPNQNKFNRYTTFIKTNQLENTLEKLQYSLRQPEQINQVNKISGEIYSWLIQPLEADLQQNKIETLVFVLDGNLRNIPMAVLYDSKAQEKQRKYLIEKYAIVLTPGLQMLEPKPLQRKKINILMAGVTEKQLINNQEFLPLSNVELELNTIQSQIPNSKKLLNQSFTDVNLEKQIDSAKYTIVHIATHGNFSSNLEETYILTWNKLLKIEEFDKLFQINKNADSQAIELLVLSACETAHGDKRATLGLSGIAIRAGARSTLASLWAVEDESTSRLMSQFYQELQQNKLNKGKALQQAQIKLLKNSEPPLIWAPYVLIGNWL
ncbi:CHAT domain-containing protein [Calothrix sp. CCY 0018]|uniref:CHAT domain-containing protein n=1 Tax=Calothrix sp. CCY 0018 TaxID=3103864 RepID=UPI0039C7238E